jgi:hypothetical protein
VVKVVLLLKISLTIINRGRIWQCLCDVPASILLFSFQSDCRFLLQVLYYLLFIIIWFWIQFETVVDVQLDCWLVWIFSWLCSSSLLLGTLSVQRSTLIIWWSAKFTSVHWAAFAQFSNYFIVCFLCETYFWNTIFFFLFVATLSIFL